MAKKKEENTAEISIKTDIDKPKLNLHQKLIEIRKQIPYLKKDAKGFNFQYAEGSLLLGLLRPKMDELGVLLNYDIEEIKTEPVERIVKEKVVLTARTTLKYVFTFIDAENPSDTLYKTIWTQGIGDDIQSAGGFNTYTVRYFLMGFFNIPSDKKDPDAFDNAIKAAQPVMLISKEQADRIDELLKDHVDIRANLINVYKKIDLIPEEYFEGTILSINKRIEDKQKKHGDKNENNT